MRSMQTSVGRFLMAAVMSGVCGANGVVAQEKPVRLIAEGEEFKVEKGDWKVVPYGENYFASTFAITFLSRMACLGAPAQVEKGQEAVASQTIKIPYADSYHVAVRYEQPYNFSVEFTVEIEQGGKVVYRDVFGRLEDPKMWPMNKNKREPMVRYWWGATDNILWQMPSETDPARMAKLSAGPAVIRLIAGPQLDNGQPRVMAAGAISTCASRTRPVQPIRASSHSREVTSILRTTFMSVTGRRSAFSGMASRFR